MQIGLENGSRMLVNETFRFFPVFLTINDFHHIILDHKAFSSDNLMFSNPTVLVF